MALIINTTITKFKWTVMKFWRRLLTMYVLENIRNTLIEQKGRSLLDGIVDHQLKWAGIHYQSLFLHVIL